MMMPLSLIVCFIDNVCTVYIQSANVRSVGLDDMLDQICGQPIDVLERNILRLRSEIFAVSTLFLVLANK